MKKLLIIALAAIGMAACTQDELVEVKGGDAIVFDDAFLDNATRAAVDPSITTNTIDGFNVWAFMDEVNGTVFENEEVTKSGDAWTYANTQYWTPNHTYYFAALAPVGGNWALNTANANKLGAGIVNFINADGGEDLLYAKQIVTTPADINAQPAAVKLEFEHLLSKVKFTFENGFTNENAKLVVKDIKMTAPQGGSIDLAVANYAEGWNLNGTDATFAYGDLEAEIGMGKKAESANERLTVPAKADYKYTITFTVELYMGNQLAQTFNETTELTGIALEMGKAYNFTANLNATNLGLYPITFDVVVDDWVEAGDVTVDPRTVYVSNLAELQAALDNATADAGYNIIITEDIAGDAIATQKEGVNLTINGNNKKYDGTIYVYGQARFDGAETLTIKNVNFESAATLDFISSNSTGSVERYAHNLTIEDCTFTGTDTSVAIRLRQAYDLVVNNVTATGLHSFAQITAQDGMKFTNVNVTALSGFNFLTATHGETILDKCVIVSTEADGYGVRVDAAADKVLNINNSNITAYEPIVLRKAVASNTTYINNTTLTNLGDYQIVVSGQTPIIYVDGVLYGAQKKAVKVDTVAELKDALTSTDALVVELAAGEYDLDEVMYMPAEKFLKANKDATIKGKLVANADLSATNVKFAYNATTSANLNTGTYGSLVNGGYAAIITLNRVAGTFEGCEFVADEACAINYFNEAEGKSLTIKNSVFTNAMVYSKADFNIDNNTFNLGGVPYAICVWPVEPSYHTKAYFTNNECFSNYYAAEGMGHTYIQLLSRTQPFNNVEFNHQGNTGSMKYTWGWTNAARCATDGSVTFAEGSKKFNIAADGKMN